MKTLKMPRLHIGDLEIKVPIIQGGMGVGISLSGLASAVANEGGVGVISSVGVGMQEPGFFNNKINCNKESLRKEIRKARAHSNGLIGVNVMVAVTDFDDMVKVALEEEADIIFLGAGLPLKAPKGLSLEYLKSMKTKVIPIVSSARAVKVIFGYWDKNYNHVPDAVVVEGPMAGGHLGFKLEQIDDPSFKLEVLVPEVCKEIKRFERQYSKRIPVIAAGGIYDGEDIYKFLSLGASGVQMGTRFVATHECDAHLEFKTRYVDCAKEEIEIIHSPVGLPGRAIISNFLEDVMAGKKKPFNCPLQCLKTCNIKKSPYCIAEALMNAKNGLVEKGFAFAGANVHRITRITSVKELMNELIGGFEAAATSMIERQKICLNN